MPREIHPDLHTFLRPYEQSVIDVFFDLRKLMIDICPDCNELIYDAYSAAGIAFSTSDKLGDGFCHLPVYSKYVNLGFNYGVLLDDPDKILKGTGKSIRHITVKNFNDLPLAYIEKLIRQSYTLSLEDLPDGVQTIKKLSVVKSISKKKRRP